mmetsp:Transcript_11816/g.39446  ORF Transcript_11816/g.39446 Transcript_11816/m.39446 type:complete len:93 (-) Transcript_11816:28-306(-)
MGPYRVIHGGVAAIELAALRSEAEALARDDPPNFDNGCVLEPLGPAHLADDDETWRRSRAAYEVGAPETPCCDQRARGRIISPAAQRTVVTY